MFDKAGRRAAVLAGILLATASLAASGLTDQADRLYAKGDLAALQRWLDSNLATTAEDIACRDYYRARLNLDATRAAEEFRRLSTSPSPYGTLAACELAAWNLLERNDEAALTITRSRNDGDLPFWRAMAALSCGNAQLAGESALAYLKTGTDSTRIELSRILLAESRFRRGDNQGGVDALTFFKRTPGAQLRDYALLRMGYGYERLGSQEAARDCYRTVLRESPYSASYYAADESLRRIGGTPPSPTRPEASRKTTPKPVANTVPPPRKTIQNQKPEERPAGSKIYLQVGVFGSKDNARNMEKTLKKLGYKVVSFDKTIDGKTCRVVTVGPFATEAKAETEQDRLDKKKIETRLIYR